MHNLIFIFLIIPPLLYSVGNIFDKKLVQVGGELSPLLIVTTSSLLALLVLPVINIFHRIEWLGVVDSLFIIFSGMLTALSVFLYLKAVESESIFSVAPALQLTPGISYIFGILFFNEYSSISGILGCILILIGSLFLTIRIENALNNNKFKFKIFIITAFSAASLAVSGSVFKFFAIKYDYWTVQYFEYIGLLILGIFLLCYFPHIRERIHGILRFKKADRPFISLNLLTEAVMVLGDFALNFATLIAPLFIAFSFNSLQPLFLLILGFIINRYKIIFNGKLDIGYFSKSTVVYVLIITLGVVLTTSSI